MSVLLLEGRELRERELREDQSITCKRVVTGEQADVLSKSKRTGGLGSFRERSCSGRHNA